MQSSSGAIDHHQVAAKPASGARGLEHGLKLVTAFIAIGWLVALAAVIAFGLRVPMLAVNFPAVDLAIPGLPAVLPNAIQISLWPVLAAVALVLPLFVGLVWRAQAVRSDVFRAASGCPQCHDQDFVRIRRRRLDRVASKFAFLKTQRQICRNCGWQGLLIDSGVSHMPPLPTLISADSPGGDRRIMVKKSKLNGRPENQPAAELADPAVIAHSQNGAREAVVTTAVRTANQGASRAIEPGAMQAIVTAPFGLKMRSEPQNDADLLAVLPLDMVVRLVDRQDGAELSTWQQVVADDLVGWVSPAFLKRLNGRGSSLVP